MPYGAERQCDEALYVPVPIHPKELVGPRFTRPDHSAPHTELGRLGDSAVTYR
jgi:hypothetical protein